jgi:hypothetical protein
MGSDEQLAYLLSLSPSPPHSTSLLLPQDPLRGERSVGTPAQAAGLQGLHVLRGAQDTSGHKGPRWTRGTQSRSGPW